MRMTIITALALLSGSVALAQQGYMPPSGTAATPTPAPSATALSTTDQRFMREAAQANLARIRLGELAQKSGASERVRSLGQRMADSHRKQNDQLKSIAMRANFQLPTEESSDQTATYDRLAKLSGSEFDKAFVEEHKSAHAQSISLFQDEAQNGTNAELKSYAQSTLPSLRQHQNMAKMPGAKTY